MTVTATSPVSGPHIANGSNRNWQFTFKVANVTHMALRVTDADGSNEQIVVSGFTIADGYLNQNAGGIVVYPVAPTAALAAGKVVYPYRVVPYDQPNRIGNQGGFFPETHEQTMDLLAMQIQQVHEITQRAAVLPVGSETPTDELIAALLGVYAIDDEVVIAANNIAAIVAAPGAAGAAALSAAAANDSAALAELDRLATAADRVQTGLDRIATAADRVQTGLDRVQTGLDRVQTGLDRTATEAARDETVEAIASLVRERLTANRTYYVRTDGVDTNTGLADNAGGAFLTINYAVNHILNTIDFAGFDVVLQIRDGTYAENILPEGGQVGQGLLILRGNTVTPANVIVAAPVDGLKIDGVIGGPINIKVEYFELRGATSRGIWINRQHAKVYVGHGMRFGACGIAHMQSHMGIIEIYQSSYSIVGNSPRHYWAEALGQIWILETAITLVGTPAFGTGSTEGFAVAQKNSYLRVNSANVVFTGAATGRRFWFDYGAAVDTSNGGANYFPGNAAGQLDTAAVHDGLIGGVRERLTANRTYYVRTDGVDTNTGLADNAGGAFLTIAKAMAAVSMLDLNGFNVTIQLQDVAWAEAVSVTAPWIGTGTVTLRGATNACQLTGSTAVTLDNGAKLTLSNLTLAAANIGLSSLNGSVARIGANMIFGGANAVGHIRTNFGNVIVEANYSIITGGARHLYVSPGGLFNMFGFSATLTGTLAFSAAFAFADRLGLISCQSAAFTGGTITGKRYDATMNGVIFTNGGGANFFPGNAVGTTATGGQYA